MPLVQRKRSAGLVARINDRLDGVEIAFSRDSDELAEQLWHALNGPNGGVHRVPADYPAVVEVLNALVGPHRYLISPMGDRVRIELLVDDCE